MPKGPKGERRPADVIGNAIHIAKIATGEIEDKPSPAPNRAKGGRLGGKRRAEALSADERRQIAEKGSKARWGSKE
jgi:hypothetical protein